MSSYLHHIGPRLSSYSVHNIYSYGKVLNLTQCVLVSLKWGTNGHSIEYPALSMVTAPPTFITSKCKTGFLGADYRIRTDDLSLTRRLHYHCAKSAYYLGGGNRTRTRHLMLAKHLLYQMSYTPIKFWCPRRDSNSHGSRHWLLRPACLPFHHQGMCFTYQIIWRGIGVSIPLPQQ